MSPAVPNILESLRCDRAANDRRRSPRVGLRLRVKLQAPNCTADPKLAWMRDLSEGGAGLLVAEALSTGQPILLHFPLDRHRSIPVRCRVVHCAKVGGFWRVGIQFIDKPWRSGVGAGAPVDESVTTSSIASDPIGLQAQIQRLSSAMLD